MKRNVRDPDVLPHPHTVDLRGSFNRLYSLVVEQLKENPPSGHLFVFTPRAWARAKAKEKWIAQAA
jgi:transposase